MLKSKASVMTEQITAIRGELEKAKQDYERKLNAQHKILNSQVLVLKDYDIKINTLIDLCLKAGVFDKGSFDMISDVRRGLRLIGPEEEIKEKDIVWVKYTASMPDPEGKLVEVSRQDELPIRTGAKTIIFEHTLYGKKVGDKYQFLTESLPDGPDKGKSFTLDIEIIKAKTKLIEVSDELDTTTDGAGAGDQGEGKLEAAPVGPGHGEHVVGNDQPIFQ